MPSDAATVSVHSLQGGVPGTARNSQDPVVGDHWALISSWTRKRARSCRAPGRAYQRVCLGVQAQRSKRSRVDWPRGRVALGGAGQPCFVDTPTRARTLHASAPRAAWRRALCVRRKGKGARPRGKAGLGAESRVQSLGADEGALAAPLLCAVLADASGACATLPVYLAGREWAKASGGGGIRARATSWRRLTVHAL
eukprot:5626344-Prymnesium_polylepis.1